ncbi:MAG TPA: hypothetical protein VNN20_10085 [Thermodesulfobacteriota bacterium]|nr:hypothetical protein [Thermodesulfobacteriota bacterium]
MLKRVLPASVMLLLLAVSVASSEDSPEAVYQKYSAAIQSKNLDELDKYLSSQRREELNEETPEDRQKMIELIAAFMPKSIRIVERQISPDDKKATLKLVGIGGISGKDEVFGKVTLVKEDSEWKINSEEWSNNEP